MNIKPFHSIVKAALPNERVFMAHMPDSVDRAVLLKMGAGGAQIDQNLPDYKKGRLQAVIRDKGFQSGYSLALSVSNALKRHRVTSDGVYILKVYPLHDPINFSESSGGFIEFSVNFETVYVEH